MKLRIVLLLSAILFFSLGYRYTTRYTTSFDGKCHHLSELPIYGDRLPEIELGQIKYQYNRMRATLYCTTHLEFDQFRRVANSLGETTIVYHPGKYDDEIMTFAPAGFIPDAKNVYVVISQVKNSRSSIRVYFVPDDSKSRHKQGTLFIHIS